MTLIILLCEKFSNSIYIQTNQLLTTLYKYTLPQTYKYKAIPNLTIL